VERNEDEVRLRDVEPGDLPIYYEHQLDADATSMAAFPARDRAAFDAHWAKFPGIPAAVQPTILVDDRVAGNIGSWPQEGVRLVGYWSNLASTLMSGYPQRLAGLCVLSALVTGCAPRVASTGPADATADPQRMFADLEARLLGAPSLRVRYTATAEGALSASLEGALNTVGADDLEITAAGTLGGSAVTAFLRADGEVLEGRAGARDLREDVPAALHEAVILGLTRMGILHNVSRLTAGAIPDRASGGVRDWVSVEDVAMDRSAQGPRPGLIALRFSIHLSGRHVADATLWLDAVSGLPVHREQTVSFPGGQMRVTESYDFVPPDVQRIDP
jgi:hypothetical protein